MGEGVAVIAFACFQQVSRQKFGSGPVCDKYDSLNALGLEGGNAAELAGEHGPVGLHGDGENAVAPGRFIAYVLPVPVRDAVEGGQQAARGLPPSSIKNILYGKSQNPKLLTVKMICDGLDIILGEFFSTEEFDCLEQEIR